MVVKEPAMSERTPDTSNGLSETAEPSMEDILASIRKIIADDEGNDVPVELSNELVKDLDVNASDKSAVPNLNNLPLNAEIANNEIETLDLDIIADVEPTESEIDALLADMDLIDTETVTAAVDDETLDLEADVMMDLEIPMEEDDLSSLDVLPDDTETLATGALETELNDDTPEDGLSSLLDDMFNDDDVIADGNDELENLDLVVDPAQSLLDNDLEPDADVTSAALTDNINTDTDIDLVKSLMAELTGVPLHDELDVTENVVADATPDLEEDLSENLFETLGFDIDETTDESEATVDLKVESPVALEAIANPERDSETDDVMDEILSLTIEDEVEIQADALEAAGIEVPLSLKDIAAQAEADADVMSSGKALAAVAALGAIAKSAQTDEPSLDLELDLEQALQIEMDEDLLELTETDDVDAVLSKFNEIVTINPENETTAELNPEEETPPMPRALKTDTIIDEVTETATADVFSSLNKVVEEKAVVAERGDRIGDLVMESLRPMLKDWLDANLKGIVERAVTKEVKRISSGK